MQNIQQVVRLCQEGHLDAFTSLFSHFQHRIYDLACIILQDEQEAEDVVQEAFLAVFQNIEDFKGESAFETWLTAIAVNECRMHLRKKKLRSFISLEQLSPGRLLGLSSRQADVEDVADSRERRQTLWSMVDKLPERIRLPIILRYRYAYPCGDIAQVLNLRKSTIYQHLNEGRRLLEQMEACQLADSSRYSEAEIAD